MLMDVIKLMHTYNLASTLISVATIFVLVSFNEVLKVILLNIARRFNILQRVCF